MTYSIKTAVAAILAGGMVAAPALAKPMVLTNAKVHTVNAKAPSAEAVAIDDNGVILAVGSEEQALGAAGKDADVVDLKGMMLLPGFQDAHMHLIEAGVNEILCEFEPFDKLEDTLATIEDCMKSSKTEWVLGSGVSITNLLDQSDNPIALLDKISPDRPVLILDDIGHGAWANSVAMHAAGYDVMTSDPPGGIILRNAKTGKPNGIVLENAQQKFDSLSLAVRNVRRGEIVGRVKVICMPAFATYWLIPKLSRFVNRYADVTLTITPPTDDDPFRDPSVDVAIMFGRPRWPHLDVRLLKQMELFPVCSPVLLSGEHKIRRSSDLLRHVLLDDPEQTHWIEWFALIGNASAKEARRLCFTDFNHNLAAARAGLGITLGDNLTTAEDLANGTLVRPLKEALRPQNNAYYILAPSGGVMSKPAQAFLEWLTAETTRTEMPSMTA